MQYTAPKDLNADEFYRALSLYGIDGVAQLGLFHAAAHSASTGKLFTLAIPVVGDPTLSTFASFATGHADYTSQGLTEAPLLLPFLNGVPANHFPEYQVFNVTATGCDYLVRQTGTVTSAGMTPTLPLNGTLMLVALK